MIQSIRLSEQRYPTDLILHGRQYRRGRRRMDPELWRAIIRWRRQADQRLFIEDELGCRETAMIETGRREIR